MKDGKVGRRPDYATWTLVASLVVAACVGGASTDMATLRQLGARPPLWGFHPRPEQLVLPLFLHFGWLHWACNLLSLLAVAASVECVAGPAMVIYLFFFSGIASILVSLIHQPQAMALGCSGAVFGIWAARVLHSWWPPQEPERGKISLFFACGMVLTVVPQKMGLPVDNWGHWGGLVAGLIGYSAYRLGWIPRVLAMLAVLGWAGYTSRPPWLPF
ncbi:rhomboid family intramembrane serine protease [bacterium]|nr:rhomboid family intramembrane serine protease [bacterium]